MALIDYNPPQEPWLDLVYRDDYIAVVNKPSGLLSVPGNQPQYYDSAMSRVKEKYGFCEPAHRKYYQALVWGHVEQEHGVVELPLICDWENRPRQKICFERGKRAVTFYDVLQRYPNNTTRVKLTPITGRSHQLRLHMLALGHPILGDKFYAHPQAKALSPRLCLHAESLQIQHPISGETMEFTAPVGF